MKKDDLMMIVYERPGPLADMFVPRLERVALYTPKRRVGTFATALMMLVAVPALMQESTLSYFNDIERSTGNTFAAGPLDITAGADHTSATLMLNQTGETFTFTITPIANDVPFEYKVSASSSGDAAFCDAISATGAAPLTYSGPATTLVAGPTSDLTPWALTLTLLGTSPPVQDGQHCDIDVAFEAYQVGGAVGTEYHDTEHVVLNLIADPPVERAEAGGATESLVVDVAPPQNDATSTDAVTTTPPVDPLPPSDAPTTDPVITETPPADTPPTDATTTPVVPEAPPPADPLPPEQPASDPSPPSE